MKIEVSIGEAIDKLNILELKLKKISDENKKTEIQKEIDVLSECHKYKDYYLLYNLLTYVNEKIWDMTDIIKGISIEDTNFANLSNQIFEFNQKRFRVKNWYNLISSSNIKEQKSYSLFQCKVIINDINNFYDKISEVLFLALEYDTITIISSFNDRIKNILYFIPTIFYSVSDDENILKYILLDSFNIDENHNKSIFELKPITYVSGGLLGDFIHQLSVINETFLETGRKGVLYIANNTGGDTFRFSLTKTYEDTYKIIINQNYIKEYKIFNGEKCDINLSDWRNSQLLYKTNFYDIFYDTFKINWGTNKWINVPYDEKFKETILISNNSYRSATNIDFYKICKIYKNKIKFLDLDAEQTKKFKSIYNLQDSDLFTPNSLYELCVAINSCKLFIGNLSGPLTFAYALHKQCIVGLSPIDGKNHFGIEKAIPNLIINSNSEYIMEQINLYK